MEASATDKAKLLRRKNRQRQFVGATKQPAPLGAG
jgi:hypothetical protein